MKFNNITNNSKLLNNGLFYQNKFFFSRVVKFHQAFNTVLIKTQNLNSIKGNIIINDTLSDEIFDLSDLDVFLHDYAESKDSNNYFANDLIAQISEERTREIVFGYENDTIRTTVNNTITNNIDIVNLKTENLGSSDISILNNCVNYISETFSNSSEGLALLMDINNFFLYF